jgi:hypothetical protein
MVAGGARTDSIQQRPLLNRRPFVLGFIQDGMFRFTCKIDCTQNHDQKLIQMMAQKEIAHGEKKNGHGTSRPLRKGKMAMVHAHCEKKNGRGKSRKMAAVNHKNVLVKSSPFRVKYVLVKSSPFRMNNVLVKSSPFRMNKRASKVLPILNEKCSSKVQPISNENEESRGTYI